MMDLHDFPKNEYERRYKRARESMAKRDLDALLVTDRLNYIYYTGHSSTYWVPHWMWASSYAYPFMFILPREKDPLMVVHVVEEISAKLTSWVSNIRTHVGYPFSVEPLEKALVELGLKNGRIGCELGPEQRLGIPFEEFVKLQKSLADAQFLDATDVFWDVRLTKSEEEVSRIRRANVITVKALETFYSKARIGITEREAARIIQQAMIEEGADRCQYFFTYPLPGEPWIHSRPLDRAFEKGECVYVDLGASYKEYACDVNRVFCVGEPSQEVKDTYNIILEAGEEMLKVVRPGVRISEMRKAFDAVMHGHGFTDINYGRVGHGTGMNVTEPPSVSHTDPTILAEGMTITIEPRISKDYGYFTFEDTILITGSGYELLTPGPRDLRTIS